MEASRTLLEKLLARLNFIFDKEDLFCWYKQKKIFLQAMAAVQAAKNDGNETLTDIHGEGYINQCKHGPLTKFSNKNRSTKSKSLL